MIRQLYEKMPGLLKITLDFCYGLIPNGVKYGKGYRETKRFLDKSEFWSKEEHEAYQFDSLKKLLIHAYEHVPYYNRTFRDCGFDPYKFEKISEIEVIPFLDKEIIEENFDDLQADNYNRKRKAISTTGGTSGKQLRFYSEKNYNTFEVPFVEKIWSRVGYKPSSKVAAIRNHVFKEGSIYRFDLKSRRWLMDNFHLSESNIEKILNKLSAEHIEFIHTYPSAIVEICSFIERTNYQVKYFPKAILATSENIYSQQKEYVESVLRTRFFTFYGHSERACIAGWCEHSDLYHVQSEYGYMELIDESNSVITTPDRLGEIVCTGFGNKAMPFIRYRTGDFASYARKQACACGRNYKLLDKIEGRWMQEMLFSKDGSKISMTALNMHSDIFKRIKQYQFYQDQIGKVVLRIVRTDDYSQKDEDMLLTELKRRAGNSILFSVEYVSQIEKTPRGKYKYIIQNLPPIGVHNND